MVQTHGLDLQANFTRSRLWHRLFLDLQNLRAA
jgi:hypothetical protein